MRKFKLFATVIFGFIFLTAFTPDNNRSSPDAQSISYGDYCDGWEDGYCEGWKDIKGGYAICPITPICPIPEIGKDGYRGGYNRGFKKGMRAAYND